MENRSQPNLEATGLKALRKNRQNQIKATNDHLFENPVKWTWEKGQTYYDVRIDIHQRKINFGMGDIRSGVGGGNTYSFQAYLDKRAENPNVFNASTDIENAIAQTVLRLMNTDPVEESLKDDAIDPAYAEIETLRRLLSSDDIETVKEGMAKTEALTQKDPQWANLIVQNLVFSFTYDKIESPEWLLLCPHRLSILIWLMGLRLKHGEEHKRYGWGQNNGPYMKISSDLTFIHDNIQYIDKLEEIQFRLNHSGIKSRFSTLPAALFKLPNLKELIVENDDLEAIPSTIGKSPLTRLQLKSKGLRVLPAELGHMPNLGSLRVNAAIEEFPDCSQMTELQGIDLDGNQLKAFPKGICDLQDIYMIRISNNPIHHLPDGLANLSRLRTLCIANTQIRTLPECLAKLHLSTFDVSQTQLENLPSTLSSLHIDGQDFCRFAEHICSMKTLKKLSIANIDKDFQLSDQIGQLSHLEELRIKCEFHRENPNRRARLTLPDNMGDLLSLRRLELLESGVTELPESMKTLTNLRFAKVGRDVRKQLLEWFPKLKILNGDIAYR